MFNVPNTFLRRFFCQLVSFLVVFFCAFSIIPAKSAFADDPVKLSDSITDPQGVIGNEKNSIVDLIRSINSSTGQSIYIVFVSSFDGVKTDVNDDGKIDSNDWLAQTAQKTSLGENDVIFAVATTKHEMVIYTSASNKYLKKKNIDAITNSVMIPLRTGDWGGSALTFCESVQKQVKSAPSPIGYIVVILVVIALLAFLVNSSIQSKYTPEELAAQKAAKRAAKQNRKRSKNSEEFQTVDSSFLTPEQFSDQSQFYDTEYQDQFQNAPVTDQNYYSQYDFQPQTDYNDFSQNYADGYSQTATENDDYNIYGDYYTNLYSREPYGSYYNEGQAKQHDQEVNAQNQYDNSDNFDLYSQYLSPNQTATFSSSSYSSQNSDLYSKYYDDSKNSLLDRFNRD